MKNTLAPKKHTLAIFERSEKEPVTNLSFMVLKRGFAARKI
ncbi:MAG: hypothetical protein U5L45_16855 [Saprospiraceae bacterium]|nr:hypothetical protein [Saprospiraceae bacterium]